MNRENEIILDVQNLKKYFPIRGGLITEQSDMSKL